MNDPEVVNVRERATDFDPDVEGARRRHLPGVHRVFEGSSLHQLHREIEDASVLVGLHEPGDARRIHARQETRLPTKASDGQVVDPPARRQDLDRDLVAARDVAASEDPTHPSFTDGLEELEAPEGLTDHHLGVSARGHLRADLGGDVGDHRRFEEPVRHFASARSPVGIERLHLPDELARAAIVIRLGGVVPPRGTRLVGDEGFVEHAQGPHVAGRGGYLLSGQLRRR